MKGLKEWLPYLVIIIVVVLIRTFIVTPVRVKGDSMVPTLENKEIVLLQKWDQSYQRFDIVVVKYQNTKLVKRVVGLPSDHVAYQKGKLYINDHEVKEDFDHGKTDDFKLEELGYDTIPEGYYFVMGDNRTNSTDSRMIGLVSEKEMLGTTGFVLFPFQKFGKAK